MKHAKTALNRQTLFLTAAAVSAGLLAAGCREAAPKTDAGVVGARPDVPVAIEDRLPVPSPPRPRVRARRPFNGTVVETMESGGYTYVRVKAGNEAIWAAAPPFAVQVGEQVEVPPGLAMPNFHSKTLDRDFDVVYFVAGIRRPASGDATKPEATLPPGHPPLPGAGGPTGHPPVPAPSRGGVPTDFSDVKKAAGGQTVAEIFADSKALAGKGVLVRGRVVKFTPRILGKNWIHLRDGTGESGTDDVTAVIDTEVKVGDTVLVRGVLSIDRDFGAGYRYDVIIENATLTVEN